MTRKIIFIYFFISISIYSFDDENIQFSYDDQYYLNDGIRVISQQGKLTDKKFNKNYLSSYFLSQKGGEDSENSRKYIYRVLTLSENKIHYNYNGLLFYFIFNPFAFYYENYNIQRTVYKTIDAELILGIKLKIGEIVQNRLEAGRSYRRLDQLGLVFSGMLNYFEYSIGQKKFGVNLNFLTGLFQYKEGITDYEKIPLSKKIYGLSLVVSKVPYLENIHVFSYNYIEPLQFSKTETLFNKEKEFRPYGSYNYRGIEFLTKNIFGIEGGLSWFRVTGYRDIGEYFYEKIDSKVHTNASLLAGILRYQFFTSKLHIAGIVTSKDDVYKDNHTDKGYAGLITDLKFLNGKSSFVLSEGIHLDENGVFNDVGEFKKPNYNNPGLQVLQIGYTYLFYLKSAKLGLKFLYNNTISRIGYGNEGIILGSFELSSFFLIGSIAIAEIDPKKKEAFIINEIQRNMPIKEYWRFYVSSGVKF